MSMVKQRATVTVVIRVIGLIGTLILGWFWLQFAFHFIKFLLNPGSPGVSLVGSQLVGLLVYVLPTALFVYMFCSGRWIVDRIFSGLARGCPSCGYDTRGIRGSVCPECGVDLYTE
ncbi:MAG: hypothetical protein AAF138_06070 [Planctomycetota bacterium]